jgi:2',3'-cyclic-nucleotide 2'-phosphodiesterase (5'-nucleotidase family)
VYGRPVRLFIVTSIVVHILGCQSAAPQPTPVPAPVATATATPSTMAGRFSSREGLGPVQLLHIGDTEAGILADPVVGVGGVARASTVLQALRGRMRSITVHAGDAIIPSAELQVELNDAPAIRTGLGFLNVQAAALGNHEFDLGEAFLADYLSGQLYPVITTTARITDGPLLPLVKSGRILDGLILCAGKQSRDGCDGLRIGIVGTSPEEIVSLSRGVKSVEVDVGNEAIVARLNAAIAGLKQQGAQAVVVLSHLQSLRREIALLAAGLRGAAVIVSGGGEHRLAKSNHRLLPGDVRDDLGDYPMMGSDGDGRAVALVATAGNLRYVGQLVFEVDDRGDLVGVDANSKPWPVDDDSLLELRQTASRDGLRFEQAVQAELAPLSVAVAASAVWLEGTRERVRNEETNLGNLTTDSLVFAARKEGHDVAFAVRNAGSIRAPIGRVLRDGDHTGKTITLLDVKSALRFDSEVVVAEVSHQQLAQTIEASLRGVGTTRGHFLQVSRGVTVVYRADGNDQEQVIDNGKITGVRTAGSRLWQLSVPTNKGSVVVVKDGVVATPSSTLKLALLRYTADGGDGWFPGQQLRYQRLGAHEQRALQEFLRDLERSKTWQRGAGYAATEGRIQRIEKP